MLKQITSIKDYRIFRDYQWPAELHDFGCFNVIYGWNGAGKTTLSTLLRHVEKRLPVTDAHVEFRFSDRAFLGKELTQEGVPNLRVFNRDFVDRAVFESAGHQLPPVYYLGEDSVETQRQIDELTRQLLEHTTVELTQVVDLKTASQTLEQFCTDQAKGIRLMLTAAGGGAYNNYDARSFKQQVQVVSKNETPPARLTAEERTSYL